MKAREIQKVNSFLALALICRENIAIIAMMPAMMANVKLLDKLLRELLSSMETQAMPITHFAKEKMNMRKELAFLINELSGIIRSYSLSVKDPIVFHQFSRGYSELYRMPSQYLIYVNIHLIKFLDENFYCFRDFGLKRDKFDQLQTLHKKFDILSSMPRLKRSIRKTETRFIPKYIAKIESLIKNQMQTLLPGFSHFPEFCKTFKSARRQIKYGRPQEVLKKRIKKYRTAPALPRTRKSSKPPMQLKPQKRPEMILPENVGIVSNSSEASVVR